jgi:hypothetical protein
MDQNTKNMEDVKDAVENEGKTADDEAGDGANGDPDAGEPKFPEFGE